MKHINYVAPNVNKRMKAIRDLWIKEHEIKRKNHPLNFIAWLVPYSIGYWAGGRLLHLNAWATSVIITLVCWIMFRYIRNAWKINI